MNLYMFSSTIIEFMNCAGLNFEKKTAFWNIILQKKIFYFLKLLERNRGLNIYSVPIELPRCFYEVHAIKTKYEKS